LFIILIFMMVLLTACNLTQIVNQIDLGEPEVPLATTIEPTTPPTPEPTETPIPTPTPTEAPEDPLTLEETSDRVINALAEKDMQTVTEFVHPKMGVRFSPYTYIEEEHLVFMPDALPGLFDSDEIFTWGRYDGTGDPIELTFESYYEAFIYSADFVNPEEMAVNEELGWSNTINNINAFFPGSSYVEYHFSGFEEEYGGMDWVSLRLVFLEEDGIWYLVGIVNDQWTI
jgi:hypothetical protein